MSDYSIFSEIGSLSLFVVAAQTMEPNRPWLDLTEPTAKRAMGKMMFRGLIHFRLS
jgi:hypothetical protein